MDQLVVPQFIDVEDKILGPVTVRQFLILLAGGLLIFLAYKFADFALFITSLALICGLSLVFAFVKVNGQTFHYFLLNIGQTVRRPPLRIWRKVFTKKELDYFRKLASEKIEVDTSPKKVVRPQHIRNLSLIVNTGGYYRPDDNEQLTNNN